MEKDRLESLETRFSYMEKTVADLDTLVLEYGRRTERLEATVRELVHRITELGADKAQGMPAGERPPHY